jgi:transposase
LRQLRRFFHPINADKVFGTHTGFEVLPKRWIVERTFAWISRNRRLARDFERYATTVTAFIRLAMIRIMLRRLAANASS